MVKYANNTSVSVDRSKAELEWILQRYGASQFAYATDRKKAMIGFVIKDRQIRMVLPLPDPSEFARTNRGKERKKVAAMKQWEQACRSSWRSLVLVIKAKLEAVDAGIVEMDDEFLAYTALPNGMTIKQALKPQLQSMFESGAVPHLLPDGRGEE